MNDLILIDTHAHLDDSRHYGGAALDATIAAAAAVGVQRMVLQGCSLAESAALVPLVAGRDALYTTLGTHPHAAKEWVCGGASMSELKELVAQCGAKCVAIGEIGLDYHYDYSTPAQQRDAFAEQLRVAAELDMPVVIHCREAWDDAVAMLTEYAATKKRTRLFHGIVHCWFGNPDQSRQLFELGFALGIGGSVTFKKSVDVQDSVRQMPLCALVLETDAPYLAPVPYRGKTNTPAYIPLIAQAVGELKNVSADEVAAATTQTAMAVYGRMGLPERPAVAYNIGTGLYVALTNRCSCDCVFCPRSKDPVIKGWNLHQTADPTRDEVRRAMERWGPDFGHFSEVVFCGFGEPTLRLDLLLETAQWAKQHGARRVRINTNGLSDLTNGPDSVRRMAGIIDTVSVSLNAADEQMYLRLNRPENPAEAWAMLHNFIRNAAALLPECVASAVQLPGADVTPIAQLAAQLGAKFRPRPHEDLR